MAGGLGFVGVGAGVRTDRRRGIRICAAAASVVKTEVTEVVNAGGGGALVNCNVTKGSKVTKHTVIIGKDTIDKLCDGTPDCVEHGLLARYIFHYFLEKKKDLTNTEGPLEVSTFPINYFSARAIFSFFPDAETRLKEMIAAGVEAINAKESS